MSIQWGDCGLGAFTRLAAMVILVGGCGSNLQPAGRNAATSLDDDTVLPASIVDSTFGEYELLAENQSNSSNQWEFSVLSWQNPTMDMLVFEWDFGDGTMSSGPNQTHTFTDSGTYEILVTAIDSQGAIAFVLSQLIEIPSETSDIPTVHAGDDQEVDEGVMVILKGDYTTESINDDVIYSWVQLNGPLVIVIHPDSTTASFVAPIVDSDVTMEFQLTVSDGNDSVSDLTLVHVLDVLIPTSLVPVARAGVDQVVVEGATVSLDGSASDDAGGPLEYEWTQLSGPTVELNDPRLARTAFVAPFVLADSIQLIFELVVLRGASGAADEVVVTVMDEDVSVGTGTCLADSDLDGTVDCHDACPFDSNKTDAGFCGCGNSDLDANNNGVADCLDVDECVNDTDCDDGVFCNGQETCVAATCQDGSSPCVGQTCDEAVDACDLVDTDPLPILGGDSWQYFKGTLEPPVEWNTIGFDGLGWASGPSGIGYGDGDDETVLSDMQGNYVTVYARHPFYVDDASVLTSMEFEIDYDDGFVAYLNGKEVARSSSMLGQGTPPTYQTVANTGDHEAGIPEPFDVSAFLSELVDGINVLAIQVHNRSLASSDCSLLPTLKASTGCVIDLDCDDGVYCNGVETCDTGTGLCANGTAPCAVAQCDEDIDACSAVFTCPVFLVGAQVGTLQRSDVVEASGLAASRGNPGVLWTHDDSGGDNVVFALEVDGTFLGTYRLGAGSVQDAEDIAIGPGPTWGVDYIFLADIGDNNSVRGSITVKRAPEPVVNLGQAAVTATLNTVDVIQLQYPGGADAPSHKDAETLLVDINGDIYVVTKRMYPNKVYRASFPQSTSSMNTMEYVTTLPTGLGMSWITAGDVSFDGRWIVLKSEQGTDYASVWHRAVGTSISDAFLSERCVITLQGEPQGEAIAWDYLGQGFFTVSEAHNVTEPIWYYARE